MVIGLTGGIGSGKSSAVRHLARRGIPVIRADEVARQLLDGDPAVRRLVIRSFGRDIYPEGGRADRRKLASAVFGHPEALARLNAILHPRTRRETERQIRRLNGRSAMVVIEAALLYEAEWDRMCDIVVAVTAPLRVRIARVCRRDGVSRASVMRRIRAQMPEAEKVGRADIVLRNDAGADVLTRRCRFLALILRELAEVREKRR